MRRLTEYLYDCTDDNLIGFWTPGNWIHGSPKDPTLLPILAVDKVIHGRSMSEPDTIKKGWTVRDLWLLWYSFVVVSFVFSALLAKAPWVLRPSTPRVPDDIHPDIELK